MPEKKIDQPACFGDLETVFPLGPDGLRHTPSTCMACGFKTMCLRTAMQKPAALNVREEMIDRAYRGGIMGGIQRWSHKKMISRLKRVHAKKS